MSLDKPIGMYLKRKPEIRCFENDETMPLSNKYIGIEIEMENVPFVLDDISEKLLYWDVTTDGSLRNYGAEFISKKLRGKDISKALDEIDQVFKNNKIEPDYTARTSNHVHVDMRAATILQLRSFCLLYLIAEPWLFKHVGNNRESNSYCVPYFFNDNGVFHLSRLFKEDSLHFRAFLEQSKKYEALNFKSLDEHGTVEFRHHHGTHDKSTLITWIRTILNLCLLSKKLPHTAIQERLRTDSCHKIVQEICPFIKTDIDPLCESRATSNIITLEGFITNVDFVKRVKESLPKVDVIFDPKRSTFKQASIEAIERAAWQIAETILPELPEDETHS